MGSFLMSNPPNHVFSDMQTVPAESHTWWYYSKQQKSVQSQLFAKHDGPGTNHNNLQNTLKLDCKRIYDRQTHNNEKNTKIN